MTNPTQLLPCGHCAGPAMPEKTKYGHPVMHWIKCAQCGASTTAFSKPADARAAWNTRAAPASVASGEVERVAKAIDPEAWGDDLPVPTRSHIESFHQRRQASIEAARRALSLTTPARAVSREEVVNTLAAVKQAWADEPIFSKLDRREIDDLVGAVLALIGGGE